VVRFQVTPKEDVSTRPDDVGRPDGLLQSDGAVWTWPGTVHPWGSPALFVLVTGTYAAGKFLASLLADASELQSVLFIPAGITVAFLIRLPRRYWWLVLAGAAVRGAAVPIVGAIGGDY
jgi:hypothetical protein